MKAAMKGLAEYRMARIRFATARHALGVLAVGSKTLLPISTFST
jgi:hypothetical protein